MFQLKLFVILAVILTFAGCGKSGQLDKFAEATEDTPDEDASETTPYFDEGEEDGQEPLPCGENQNNSDEVVCDCDCGDCHATCSEGCSEDAEDSINEDSENNAPGDSNTVSDVSGNSSGNSEIIYIQGTDNNSVFSLADRLREMFPGGTEDNGAGNDNSEGGDGDQNDVGNASTYSSCLELEDPDSHWWLVYQLIGGILNNTGLEIESDGLNRGRDGTQYNYTVHFPDSDEVVISLERFKSDAVWLNGVASYAHDDYFLSFNNFLYEDPVMGDVTIAGEVKCYGNSLFRLATGVWTKRHSCTVAANGNESFLINYRGEDYSIVFDVQVEYNGRLLDPYEYSFTQGDLWINDNQFNLPESMPTPTAACIKE